MADKKRTFITHEFAEKLRRATEQNFPTDEDLFKYLENEREEDDPNGKKT